MRDVREDFASGLERGKYVIAGEELAGSSTQFSLNTACSALTAGPRSLTATSRQ
jgi:hypothetical protein